MRDRHFSLVYGSKCALNDCLAKLTFSCERGKREGDCLKEILKVNMTLLKLVSSCLILTTTTRMHCIDCFILPVFV